MTTRRRHALENAGTRGAHLLVAAVGGADEDVLEDDDDGVPAELLPGDPDAQPADAALPEGEGEAEAIEGLEDELDVLEEDLLVPEGDLELLPLDVLHVAAQVPQQQLANQPFEHRFLYLPLSTARRTEKKSEDELLSMLGF